MMTVLSTPENKSLAGPKVGEALAEFTLVTADDGTPIVLVQTPLCKVMCFSLRRGIGEAVSVGTIGIRHPARKAAMSSS